MSADDDGDIVVGIEGGDLEETLNELAVIETPATGDKDKADDPLSSLLKHHPECTIHYKETVIPKLVLSASPPLKKDPNHRSHPFITQYEKTHVIGKRANMLSQGARPYVDIPPHITDVSDIAKLELEQRRLPFIICRTMPNGTHEMWRLSDLMIL
jgi:DNA-directed RNA polymerase subunit K/omega